MMLKKDSIIWTLLKILNNFWKIISFGKSQENGSYYWPLFNEQYITNNLIISLPWPRLLKRKTADNLSLPQWTKALSWDLRVLRTCLKRKVSTISWRSKMWSRLLISTVNLTSSSLLCKPEMQSTIQGDSQL